MMGMLSNLDFSFLTGDVLVTYLTKGLLFSIELTLVAMVGGIALGTVLALMRLSPLKWVSAPASFYVTTMRSIPLVMVILWFFLLIPAGFYAAVGGGWGLTHRSEMSALITFTAFEAAYYAEIMRAGIQSVPKGQVHAGYAMGMTYGQTMQPVLLTQTIILVQDTSLVYAIGAYDLLKGFELTGKNFNRPVEAYLVAAVVYFVICFSLSRVVRHLQNKIAIIR